MPILQDVVPICFGDRFNDCPGFAFQVVEFFDSFKKSVPQRLFAGGEGVVLRRIILVPPIGCSVDYLLGRTEEKEKPTAPEGDELDELLKDPETREFYELIKDFSDDELEDLLNYGQYLIAKRDSKEKP